MTQNGLTMTEPTNNVEALTLALYLAITAPSDEQAQKCIAIAENLAATMPEIDVKRAQRDAQIRAENA
jgi:hypothetical protein